MFNYGFLRIFDTSFSYLFTRFFVVSQTLIPIFKEVLRIFSMFSLSFLMPNNTRGSSRGPRVNRRFFNHGHSRRNRSQSSRFRAGNVVTIPRSSCDYSFILMYL
jgi:hypothetical protein